MTFYITKRPRKNAAGKPGSGSQGNVQGGFRKQSVKVKTARGRTNASQRWLQRQLNDPYVQRAQAEGFRARSAYKLMEIDEKFDLITPGSVVADLGCAPGSWSEVVFRLALQKKTRRRDPADRAPCTVIAIDILEMAPIDGVTFLQGDFLDPGVQEQLRHLVPRPLDVVLSDMAAVTTGHKDTDHLRTQVLADAALTFALKTLKPGGHFCTKVFSGGAHQALLETLKPRFKTVRHFKPNASRPESPEIYLVALGHLPAASPSRL